MSGQALTDIEVLFADRPRALQAIEERVALYPEYRAWLQSFGHGVLEAVEHERSRRLETSSASP